MSQGYGPPDPNQPSPGEHAGPHRAELGQEGAQPAPGPHGRRPAARWPDVLRARHRPRPGRHLPDRVPVPTVGRPQADLLRQDHELGGPLRGSLSAAVAIEGGAPGRRAPFDVCGPVVTAAPYPPRYRWSGASSGKGSGDDGCRQRAGSGSGGARPGRRFRPVAGRGLPGGDPMGGCRPGDHRLRPVAAALLESAVVVAHNVLFDVGFLRGEFQHAGLTLPPVAALCTAQLTRLLYPDTEAKLAECCRRFGIDHGAPHTALSDARATARLLTLHLETARARGLITLADLEWLPGPPLPPGWGPWPRGGRGLRRADVPQLPALRGGAHR